jgi:hypothetical protein
MVRVPLLYRRALVDIHEHSTFYNSLYLFYNRYRSYYNLDVDYMYNDRWMIIIPLYNMRQQLRRLKLLGLDLYPACKSYYLVLFKCTYLNSNRSSKN